MPEKEFLANVKELLAMFPANNVTSFEIWSLIVSIVSVIISFAAIFMAWKIYHSTREVSQKTDSAITGIATHTENIQRDIKEVIIQSIKLVGGNKITDVEAESAANSMFPITTGALGRSVYSEILKTEPIENGKKFSVKVVVNRDVQNPSTVFFVPTEKYSSIATCNMVSGESCNGLSPKASILQNGELNISLPNTCGDLKTPKGEYIFEITAIK